MCYHRNGWQGNRFDNGRAYAPWSNRFTKQVPVNIRETEDSFEVSLYAAGLQKESFTIAVKDDLLHVSYQPAEQTQTDNARFTRREYHDESFQRSFALHGKVLTEKIVATYAEGILKITLAKDPEKNQPGRNISVA